MSARPRLVQEGSPVNTNAYNDGGNDYYVGGRDYGGRDYGGRDYGGYNYRGRGYGGRGYGNDYYSGYRGGRGRGRYYFRGGYYGRGRGRGRYFRGGRGRGRYYYGGRYPSLQARAGGNFPPGPRTTISTRLVVGGGAEGQENQYHEDGGYYDEYFSTEEQAMIAQMDEREYAEFMQNNEGRFRHGYKKGKSTTRLVIGGEAKDEMDVEIIPSTYNEELHQIERMEGVESLDGKEPLVVMDGPNIAYAYADAMAGLEKSTGDKRQPDARGLLVAAQYFLEAGVRVLIVLPAPWFRTKPREGDENQENAMMLTQQLEVMQELKDQGLLVAAPPRDDDDAYALTIGRREAKRANDRGEGGGYVLSNDMFRDAMGRDATLSPWLKDSNGRVSFAFCDMGSTDTFGDRELDFIPNPRHPLVEEINSHVYGQGEYVEGEPPQDGGPMSEGH